MTDRLATLTTILKQHRVPNDDGGVIEDFTFRQSDRLDFGSVDRGMLQSLMEAAFEEGRKQGAREMMSTLEAAHR